jgi:hypothetical protein
MARVSADVKTTDGIVVILADHHHASRSRPIARRPPDDGGQGGETMRDDLAPRGYYEGLTARSLMAGWARREQPTGSKSEMHVHVWRADETRAALQEASRFVGTDVAERRNLIMVNPAPGNTYATTRNIMRAATARASSAICLHKVAEYDAAMPHFRDGAPRKRNHDHRNYGGVTATELASCRRQSGVAATAGLADPGTVCTHHSTGAFARRSPGTLEWHRRTKSKGAQLGLRVAAPIRAVAHWRARRSKSLVAFWPQMRPKSNNSN